MTTIGASLIVKNEELLLEDCLKSIQGLDEIVIVDTGSTDRTGEIARKYTNKFIEGEYLWNNNFAEARNFALQHNTTDWILALDADERLDPGGVEIIRQEVEKLKNIVPAISIIMYNDNESFYHPRLFKNKPEYRFTGKIHECIIFDSFPYKVDSIKMKFTPHAVGLEGFNRNISIIEQELREKPDDLRLNYVAGREYFLYGYYPNAIYWLERFKKNCIPWGHEYADAMYTLGICYFKMGEVLDAQKNCLQAIGINADFKEAFDLMARIAEKQNDKTNQGRWKELRDNAQNKDLTFIKKMDMFPEEK